MKTDILFKDSATREIMTGVDILTNAVSTTLGPRGRNVSIARGIGKDQVYERKVVHDGVSVATALELTNEHQNQGANILREAAKKTVDVVGDGTTATIIIAHAIAHETQKQTAQGVDVMGLREGIEEAAQKVIKELKKNAIKIESKEQKTQVATISAEDAVLGKLIATVVDKVGADGIITVEESKSVETYVEQQEGMMIEAGYVSPYFVTDPTTMTATVENGYVLLSDQPITNFLEIAPFLQNIFTKQSRMMTIIAPDFGGDALPSFIKNKMDGHVLFICIKLRNASEHQKEVYQDIASLTGAKVITTEAGKRLKDLTMGDLGQAEVIKVDKGQTLIVRGKGKQEDIDKRIANIKERMNDSEVAEYDREKLRERLGKFTNGIAAIYVGGATEIEMKERKERVDDSYHATQAAVRSGIVPGGEIAFLKAIKVLGDSPAEQILKNALERPFYKLLENASMEPARFIDSVTDVLGIDVTDRQLKNLIEHGIIDPVEVPIECIKNAVSVAVQLITIGASIVPIFTNEPSKT